jgi:hypothetical protein
MEPISYAITTKDRIKAALAISSNQHDEVLDRLIASITDWIESQTNRRFKKTTYTNETYGVNAKQDFLLLRQTPVLTLTSFQYRSGLPNAITWTNVNPAEYELGDNPEAGIIETYFHLTQGPRQYRVTYDAGYLIDWTDPTDPAKHTLPNDLTQLADKMVIKAFKKREKHGIQTESFEGNQISWQKELDQDDDATIKRYRRELII